MADLVFVIDGTDYEAPDLDSFDMAERRVMFDLSGIIEEDFVQEENEAEDDHKQRVRKLTRHPGFMEALMHIAYARGNPDVKRQRVQELIEKTNYREAIQKWADVTADAENPPVSQSTSEPDEASPTATADSSTSSGLGSPASSDPPDSNRESTGTTESGTSPTLAPRLSVA